MKKTLSGFTLIELIIAILIVSILAGIAIPAYRDYVTRGYLINATNALAAARAQMEQYYQDNRTYQGADTTSGGGVAGPCVSQNVGPSDAQFGVSCTITVPASASSSESYTITATGAGQVSGFIYTVDNQNNMTTKFPTKWGGSSYSCWVLKKGQTC
jgi:type IV pilus assembly protein PilE